MRLIKMEIVPDARMIPAALAAVRELSSSFFSSEKKINSIILSLEEAIANITQYCLTPSLKHIDIEVSIEDCAFVVSVIDEGLPGDLNDTLSQMEKLGLSIMYNMMDEVTIENLGFGGRKQKMIKYLEKPINFQLTQPEEPKIYGPGTNITIRPFLKEDAVEISRCIYDAYGFSYAVKFAYYPEQFCAAVQDGIIHSMVAVDDEGNIAGHAALCEWKELPGIWELCMVVVKGNYRKLGIMSRLSEALLEYAQNTLKLPLVIMQPVLHHPFSQKVGVRYDMHPCALGFGYIPQSLLQSMGIENAVRADLAICIRTFETDKKTLYIPLELHDFIEKITDNLKVKRTFVHISNQQLPKKSNMKYTSNNITQSAKIVIYNVGEDIHSQLILALSNLKKQNMEMIELFIHCNEAGALKAFESAKSLGFFCTGFIPMAQCGDMLMMQNLFSYSVDYSRYVTVEPFTSFIESVKAFDPDIIKE